MSFNLRSLGGEEAKVILGLAAKRRSTVTASDVIGMVGEVGRARGVIRRLLAKGWLQRASNGHYVVLPPEWGVERMEDYDVHVLASASVDRGYVGWWAAASKHGFTMQLPDAIHVATDRSVPPRTILDTPVRYVRLAPRKFFGWQEMVSYGRSFRISTPEKTVVDCVDKPEICGGPTEVAVIVSRAAQSVCEDVLIDDARKFGVVSTMQRLGYLLDLVVPGFLSDAGRSLLRNGIPPTARSVLGRAYREPGDVGYVHAWGLLVNASESDLTAEVNVRQMGI